MRTFAFLFLLVVCPAAVQADPWQVLPADQQPKPAEMMKSYLTDLAHQALAQRRVQYEQLKTPEQLADWQAARKQFFIDQLGGFPERTPLNPQIVGKKTLDGYRREKIIFESQPRHYVTAILYLPLGEGPHPGVILPCGHSANGKAAETYQRASILLAKNGIAVLCYDPIAQGERTQWIPPTPEVAKSNTASHTVIGLSCIPLGTNTARYRIWDGIRALDYLASRPEIDPQRLGCTGNSGGGTLTSYLMALDERILCAAPSCYLTTFDRLLDTIGPQDAEQNIYAQVGFGMDHADYVLMRAPRPTLMCVATHDFFDINGAWDTFRQAKRFYTRLGYAERVDLIETDAKHGFSVQLREGATRWMRRWLLDKHDAIFESEFPIASDADLQCSPTGQVMEIPGARSVFDLNRDWLARLETERKGRWSKGPTPEVLNEVRKLAGVRPLDKIPAAKATSVGNQNEKELAVEKLILHTEQGIDLPALKFVPKNPGTDIYLYVHGEGKQADAGEDGPIQKLVAAGNTVIAVDLRGLGETASGGAATSPAARSVGADSKDFFLAYLIGKSYVGMRTEDILSCAKWLQAAGANSPGQLHLIAVGQAGPAALHAATLEPQLFASATVRDSLNSWAEIVMAELPTGPLTATVHGALKVYDLPNLREAIPSP